jgi:hypothetical protein
MNTIHGRIVKFALFNLNYFENNNETLILNNCFIRAKIYDITAESN